MNRTINKASRNADLPELLLEAAAALRAEGFEPSERDVHEAVRSARAYIEIGMTWVEVWPFAARAVIGGRLPPLPAPRW